MLELGTVDLYHRIRVAKKNFGGGLYDSGLARACWTEKKHRAKRSRRARHTGLEHLIQRCNAAHRAFLPDYPCAQPVFKFLCPGTLAVRVERYQLPFLTVANHFPNLLSAPLCS